MKRQHGSQEQPAALGGKKAEEVPVQENRQRKRRQSQNEGDNILDIPNGGL